MLYLISYIIKILFSLVITYFIINLNKNDLSNYKIQILKYNFLYILLLNPIYAISIQNNDMILFAIVVIMFFSMITILNKYNKAGEIYFINYLSLLISILIAADYLLYTIICIGIYLFMENNILNLINNEGDNDENNDENNEIK